MSRLRPKDILIAAAFLGMLSCTRMPTAPRVVGEVVGRVEGPSGEPLPGAWLSFISAESRLDDYGSTTTDSTGTYTIQLLEGIYRVRIQAPSEDGPMRRTEQVQISKGRQRHDFSFRGHRVTGTVRDPYGNAVDSGWVQVLIRPEEALATSLVRQGAYSLVIPTGMCSFVVWHADYWAGFAHLQRDSIIVNADTTLDFQLDGVLLSGKVLGPDGTPMKDVAVRAEGAGPYVQNRTALDGRYRLFLHPATYRLWFQPPYFFIFPRVVGPIDIAAPVSVDCDLSGVEWAGTVRRVGTNEAVSGIIVGVRMDEDEYERGTAITTGSQGEFRFILEPDRSYSLRTYDQSTDQVLLHITALTAASDTTLAVFVP